MRRDLLERLPNVLLTPRVGYVTRENLQAWFTDVVEDVAAYLAGSPIRTLGVGTRSIEVR